MATYLVTIYRSTSKRALDITSDGSPVELLRQLKQDTPSAGRIEVADKETGTLLAYYPAR